MATVRYSVWVRADDVDDVGVDDLDGTQLEAVEKAFKQVPGFKGYSLEDSYKEED